MREPLDRQRLEEFFQTFGSLLPSGGRIYLTGGTSALLYNWRLSTIDVDLSTETEPENFYPAITQTKNKLNMNLEVASPADFVPPLPGWQMRSKYITSVQKTDFYHFDFYTQAFSKIARSHQRDLSDVAHMLKDGLIEPVRLIDLFNQIEDQLERYPAISPGALKEKLTHWHSQNS